MKKLIVMAAFSLWALPAFAAELPAALFHTILHDAGLADWPPSEPDPDSSANVAASRRTRLS